ncbi:hypothetical protein QP924_09785 [Corynebacterium pseudodiphtheriticum]|uniref:hypothetical protein n=1 Tax=Corynebacterium pseudodiphtheriticum TaxID=37637 RepID=UPI0025500411|nr:hypothetical protein [Corynebacterium pseudodiphtheriticum]MDK8701125.1 hypothetical protein [Corynebacterium pseudodiphtheriticum]
MKELDELLEWIDREYDYEYQTIWEHWRNGIDRYPSEEAQALSAKHRMDAYYRVRQQIRAMQERHKK